jgi:hypothetical protein
VKVGSHVLIERDEELYPSKGSWPQFRGRRGTVVSVNADHALPHLTEYGVSFGWVAPRADGRGAVSYTPRDVVWFKDYELEEISK